MDDTEKQAAVERLLNIVKVWRTSMETFPPEIQAQKTSMVVLRGPDIDAIELAARYLVENR